MARELLKTGDKINGKQFQYEIESVSGYGASCVVYKARYEDEQEQRHLVQIKEFYPHNLGISRDKKSHNLICADSKQFEAEKRRFINNARKLAELNNDDKTNSGTPYQIEPFEANQTAYSVVAYNAGEVYTEESLQSMDLSKLLKIMINLVRTVGSLHENNYVHLDIKPDNFLVDSVEHITLFDIDSIVSRDEITTENIQNISYTKKWAAPEVKRPNITDISYTADIFSIGVILFEAIMCRPFLPTDTVSYTRDWDIERNILDREEKQNRKVNLNPKFYYQIKEIFEKTLDRNPDNRYKTATELYKALDKARDLLKENPWIISSFRTVTEQFTGRKNELAEMNSIMQKEDTVFLHGFGGIGKSELALKYAEKHKEDFDTVVFCKYQDDIKDALSEIRIAHFENDDNTKYLKKLAELCDERTLIILDNFDVETDADDYLDEFINNYHCKKVITTRTDFSGAYKQLKVDVLGTEDAISLFEKESKWSPETEDEEKTLNEILKLIGYHTYFTSVLAKKKEMFRLSIDELKKQTEELLLKKSGKVEVYKDGKLTTATIDALAEKLFAFDTISESHKQTLYNLYMLSWRTVSSNDYAKIVGFGMSETDALIDELNYLTSLGWIQHDEKSDDFFLHPIMQEMVKKHCNDADNYANNMVEYYLESCRLIKKDDEKIRRLIWRKGPHSLLHESSRYAKDKAANKHRADSIIHFANCLFSVSTQNICIVLELLSKIIDFVSRETKVFHTLVGNINKYCCSPECPPELQKQWLNSICNELYSSFNICDGECERFYFEPGEYARLCVSFYKKSGLCKDSSWDVKRGYWILVRDYIEREKDGLSERGAILKALKLNEYELELINCIDEIKDVLCREEIVTFEAFKNENNYKKVKEHLGANFNEPFGAVSYKRYLAMINNSTYGQKEVIKDLNSDEKVSDVEKIFTTAKQNSFELAYQELLANIKLTYEEKRKILFVLFAASFEAIANHLKNQGDDNLDDYANFLILYAQERLKLQFYPDRGSYLGTLLVGIYLKNKENFKEILYEVFLDYFSRYFKKEECLNANFWKSMCYEFAEFNILNIIFPFVYERINTILAENDIDEISFWELLKILSHQVYIETNDRHYLEMEKGYKEKIYDREKNRDSLENLLVVKETFDYKIKE